MAASKAQAWGRHCGGRCEYISREQLQGFDNYKYSCIDSSPVSNYITHPFWNQVVKIYPKWLAPNLMTFVGFLCQVVGVAIVSFYDFDFTAQGGGGGVPPGGSVTVAASSAGAATGSSTTPSAAASSAGDVESSHASVPRWVWLVCALLYFLAHTLDGTDGKQARRTNSSTPLGELFDHGLDSLACYFISTPIFSLFGCDPVYGVSPHQIYFLVVSVMVTFVTSHYEKYLTGVLYLPWTYDLSQIGLVAAYLFTYAFGAHMWHFKVPGTDVTSSTLLRVVLYGGAVMSLLMSAYNIYVSYRDKTGKMLGVYEALRPLFAPWCWFVFGTVWALESPTDIVARQPRAFCFLVSVIFSNITCRLIIAQMSSTRADAFNWLLLPFITITILITVFIPTATGVTTETVFLFLLVALTTTAHLHYGYVVVHQLADNFNIRIFSLKPRHGSGVGGSIPADHDKSE